MFGIIQLENKQMKAVARVNFALIKYWGKKDEDLKIPFQSSLSFTVDKLYTETEVVFSNNLLEDKIIINDKEDEKVNFRVKKHLDYIRNKFNVSKYAYVNSKNYVPTAAGLASSASAFAALTYAAIKELGINLTNEELSKIARVGSGSASRSIYGNFAIWHHGESDATSYAESLNVDWDDFRIIVCLIDQNEKKYSSTKAMQKSVENKELYNDWVKQSETDLAEIIPAIKDKDIKKVGLIAERNAMMMHNLIDATGITYKSEKSIEVINRVKSLRIKGINAYITMDAGPNVKIITLKDEVSKIVNAFNDIPTIVCSSGKGIEII